LVHQRPVARLRGLQRRQREQLLEIGHDRARLVQHEVGVLEDRHAVERMQREVLGRAHVGFEVVEPVRHLLVRQHQLYDVHEAAGRKAENRDVSHRAFSPLRFIFLEARANDAKPFRANPWN
jgi:hypothetical protein